MNKVDFDNLQDGEYIFDDNISSVLVKKENNRYYVYLNNENGKYFEVDEIEKWNPYWKSFHKGEAFFINNVMSHFRKDN